MFEEILVLLGISLFIVSLDSIYLYTNRKYFDCIFKRIQGTSIKLNIIGALIAYVSIICLLYLFLILKKSSYLDAFLLGVLTYAIYHGTNMATFKHWDIKMMMFDSLWGGTLFLTTLVFYNSLLKY